MDQLTHPLAAYLKLHNISFAEMARRVGASHARTVERHAKGRVPNPKFMRAYCRETGGEINANHFIRGE